MIVSHPAAGGIVVLVALAAVALDVATGRSPGRRLTREHASQNVVSVPTGPPGTRAAGTAGRSV